MTDDALIRSTLFVLSLAGSFADRAARLDRPLLVGQGFLRPYLLAEHTACAFTRDCLENTRTTLTLWLVRLFAWNMPYHAEHHAYPAVPFHALPRLHAQVRGKIANLEPGYVAATTKVNRYLFARPREASRGVASAPR